MIEPRTQRRALNSLRRACVLGWLAWACLPLGLGCDGVGRALVGERPVSDPHADPCDRSVPSCVDPPLPVAPVGLPDAATAVDLEPCRASRIAVCPRATQGRTGGDPVPVAPGCEPEHNSDDTTTDFGVLARRSCDALRIVGEDQLAAPIVQLADVQLDSVNVRIDSARPLTLQLVSASLLHVWFELHGPITLSIEASANVHDLRVSAPEPAAGRAQLTIENVRADALAIGTVDAAFGGDVVMRRSTLQHLAVHASSLELESVSAVDMRVDTQRLSASDATLLRMASSADRTLLADCTVSEARFADCAEFTAIAGIIKGSRIDGCSEPARLYGTSFSDGVLDGPVALDHANLSAVRFGLHERADIQAWDSHISYVRFCSPLQSASFGGTSSIVCGHCEPSHDQPRVVDACVVDGSSYEAMGSADSCQALATLALCAEPEPTRMRPPF
jgi:hypothetical protein